MSFGKSPFGFLIVIFLSLVLGACSTNPATGKNQFTGLMPAAQEEQIGASEHQKIIAQFGLYNEPGLQSYVSQVGAKLARNTERPDVNYKFFVLDSPIVNAMALPGGYVYISRGILALANNEAEMAAVMAHEIGHVTARHSAERYSHGVVTSLGAAVLSAALDSGGASQALGVGSNLYMSSYSRGQESEADSLGMRYMTRAGYDPSAMTAFLTSMQNESALESGGSGNSFNYFSTHPATPQRVAQSRQEEQKYPRGGETNRDTYLSQINGMTYGDSIDQGIIRGRSFYHPVMGFTFTVPQGFKIVNQPDKVAAISEQTGAVIIFDMVRRSPGVSAQDYVERGWMKDANIGASEATSVNGRNAATVGFNGAVNGKPMNIRLMAIEWSPGQFARFQIAIPQNASSGLVNDLKRASYSLRSLDDSERTSIKPYQVHTVIAGPSHSVENLAASMPQADRKVERFRVMNGLNTGENITAGQRYKIIVSE